MPISTVNLQEMLNKDINMALAGGLTTAQIATALTNASTAVTALSGVTHDRTIQDPGPSLNPAQPD
jgi:hypothetical protein